jgi:hypothetical protein
MKACQPAGFFLWRVKSIVKLKLILIRKNKFDYAVIGYVLILIKYYV